MIITSNFTNLSFKLTILSESGKPVTTVASVMDMYNLLTDLERKKSGEYADGSVVLTNDSIMVYDKNGRSAVENFSAIPEGSYYLSLAIRHELAHHALSFYPS